MNPLGPLELTGRSRAHVIELAELSCCAQPDAAAALLRMRAAAARDGLDLTPASGYRDFARQRAIWNAKYRGERKLLDRDGRPVEHAALAPQELIGTILLWSSLPGASRHHWGTDFDLIDMVAVRVRRAVQPDWQPQLLPEEFAPGAVFGPLAAWLDRNAARFGFFRPYRIDAGGVLPEPWHLSYAPLAVPALERFSIDDLRAALLAEPVDGRDEILRRLPELFERYVRGVSPP
ncbi:MAG: M15 family metallopeptidase, partial [Steroidobacteraceae bacterium]|nr:M15 family metallopeptidase [Steroidobacteraceae bacterium]